MPGAVPPPPEDYDVRFERHVVRDADCGLNSHDVGTLRGLADFLDDRSERGWEALSVHRVVWVPPEPLADVNGVLMRGREVRHEIALRRSPPRRKWLYKIDALSDPINPQVEKMLSTRVREGWELIGCSTFDFRAVTTGVDGNPLEHHTIDAVLAFKRAAGRSRR